jgi:hypothetical protein
MSKYQPLANISTSFGPCAGRTAPSPYKHPAHRVQLANGPSPNPRGRQGQIEYRTTCDLPDGQPCPPFIEDGIAWRVVMRAGGHTIWTRPLLKSSSVSAWRTCRKISTPRRTRPETKGHNVTYNLRDYSGEYFIKPDDVREKPLRRRIADVRKGSYDKLEAVFDSGEVLSLNATNTRALSRVYGGSSDQLIGKVV